MRAKHARSIRLGTLYAKEAFALGLVPECRDFKIVEDILDDDKLTLYSFYSYLIRGGFYDSV